MMKFKFREGFLLKQGWKYSEILNLKEEALVVNWRDYFSNPAPSMMYSVAVSNGLSARVHKTNIKVNIDFEID